MRDFKEIWKKESTTATSDDKKIIIISSRLHEKIIYISDFKF